MNILDWLQSPSQQKISKNQNKYKLSKNKQQLVLSALQSNLFKISSYLDQSSILNIKLTCRLFNYTFISHQIWQGIKQNVAQKKVEFYDDIDFVQEQPTKNINKEQRKIRIHSLKKNLNVNKNRQPSNIKNKSKAINMLNQQMLFRNTEIGFKKLVKPGSSSIINSSSSNTISTNLPNFRRNIDSAKNSQRSLAQIKKQTLKNSQQKQQQQQFQSFSNLFNLIQLSSQYSQKDLIIKVNDPWHLNMNRANNLIAIIKRWNQFHIKLKNTLISKEKNTNIFDGEDSFSKLLNLIKNLKDYEKNTNQYYRIFYQSANLSYREIVMSIQGAKNGLLIDENLNKVAKKFLEGHQEIIKINGQIGPFIQKLKTISRNINKAINKTTINEDDQELDSTISSSRVSSALTQTINDIGAFNTAQFLNVLDQSIGTLQNMAKQYSILMHLNLPNIIFTFDGLIQSQNLQKIHKIILSKISLNYLCQYSQDFQLIFQIYSSSYAKLITLTTAFEQENLILNMTLNKFKAMRQVVHHLWNVTKYFNKLQKQVEKAQKNEKKKNKQKLQIIQDFLKGYSNYKTQFQIFNYKNLARLQKQMNSFKEKVSKLKSQMQNQ